MEMQDIHNLSTLNILYRFAELCHLHYELSNRTRRACVAFIFRVSNKNPPICNNYQILTQSYNNNNNNTIPPNFKYSVDKVSHSRIISSIYSLSMNEWFRSNEVSAN